VVLFQHIFWFFGHPEVYILILPSMGIVSEVLPVFSRKPLFGYRAFVFATLAIGLLGFGVWAHHMFTTGVVYAPFFAFLTGAIAIPTGVKFFNWIATMWRGKLTMNTAMLFAIGFLMLFLIGGIDGVFLASPAIDYHLQDTYWVVSHLHYVLFAGSVFGIFAGFYYWWPKMTGRFLSEALGQVHFWLMFVGANLTFFPMHLAGLEGMPRRIANYDERFAGYNLWETIGAYVLGVGVLVFVVNLALSFRKPKTAEPDAWGLGNGLEWATTSPPPPWNFERLPPIRSERPVFDVRHAHELGHVAVAVTATGDAAGAVVEEERPVSAEEAEEHGRASRITAEREPESDVIEAAAEEEPMTEREAGTDEKGPA
jgi:cytochrome c oxidase subunit 1